jgi:hypothetical protein
MVYRFALMTLRDPRFISQDEFLGFFGHGLQPPPTPSPPRARATDRKIDREREKEGVGVCVLQSLRCLGDRDRVKEPISPSFTRDRLKEPVPPSFTCGLTHHAATPPHAACTAHARDASTARAGRESDDVTRKAVLASEEKKIRGWFVELCSSHLSAHKTSLPRPKNLVLTQKRLRSAAVVFARVLRV